MDNDIQQNIENALSSSQFEGDKLSLVADNNGRVLAYMGDSYFNLSTMKRSPASTIKPLIVYLPAIANNIISPITPLLDEKLDEEYSPKNAGDTYLGWISSREALSHSSNVCAIKLLNQVGIDVANDYGHKLNLFSNYHNNPSIALGDIGGGVSAISLARAYGVLQNNGIDKGLTFIDKIEDKNGKIIYQNHGYNNKLFNQEDCMVVNDMLVTCASSGTAKRLNDLPFEVASKTGTAVNNGKNTDLWNIAYTTEHLVLSWCGDATSKGLDGNFSSSFYPTMINKNILSNIYSNHSPASFKLSDNIVKIAIDSVEYDTLHQVSLAPTDAPERYKIYDIFKSDNLPTNTSSTYLEPTFNLSIDLTNTGAKINLDYNPIYTYKIFATSNNNTRLIGEYSNEIYDDKVFSFDSLQYYAVATNKYTNKEFVSEKIHINPEEYLVEMLNRNYINQNRQTKTKWYV